MFPRSCEERITMHIESAFPSKYLKGADLNGKTVRATIDRVEIEEVGDGDRKPVVYFRNSDKGLALNRINADTISSIYGPETDDWQGLVVELYFDPNVYYGPKKVGGLRVRVPKQATAPEIKPAGNGQGYTERDPPPPRTDRRPPIQDLDDEIPF